MLEQLRDGKSWDQVFGGAERTRGHAVDFSDESEEEEDAAEQGRAHAGDTHDVPGAASAARAPSGEAQWVASRSPDQGEEQEEAAKREHAHADDACEAACTAATEALPQV